VAAKKQSAETALKLATIKRRIVGYEAMIGRLEELAAVGDCHADVLVDLGNARAILASLKVARRRPSNLRIATHDLLRNPAALADLKRTREKGTGTSRGAAEKLLAVVDIERARLESRYGSVEKFRLLAESQRRQASKGRARSDKPADDRPNIASIVSALAKKYPTRDDGTPAELWQEFGGAIREAFENCESVSPTRYRYKFWPQGKNEPSYETIGLKHFGALLGDARKAMRR
jgi:hypothetical protein